MALLYVTGLSGTGKSAVLSELLARGCHARGVDEDAMPTGSAWRPGPRTPTPATTPASTFTPGRQRITGCSAPGGSAS